MGGNCTRESRTTFDFTTPSLGHVFGNRKIGTFPGGHHVYLGGFDGVVDCGHGNHIVPPGVSGWEFTTEKNVIGKANDDFEKRTRDSKGFDRNKTTFIFATPCRWPKGREWEREKKATKQWRDVRVVDYPTI